MRPFPAEPMRMWPISTRVNKPENDDPFDRRAHRFGKFCCVGIQARSPPLGVSASV
jgi:hypothetical protein